VSSMILVVALYALFGLTFTLGKITLFYARPFFIIGFRMLIGSFGLMSYIYLAKKKNCYPVLKDVPYYLQIALFGIFIPYSLRAWGLQYISSTKAAFLFTLMPFFTALFAYFINKERLSYQKVMGLLLGFTGMIPTLLTGSSLENLQGSIVFFSLPEIAMLGAVASFGYNLIATQKLVKHRKCHPLIANSMSMLIGGSLAFSASLLSEPVAITGDYTTFLLLVGAQVLISNLICLNLQAYLLNYYSPTFMAFAGFLSPLCAAVYGYILLHEKVSWNYILSFCIVVIGLSMYYYDDFKRQGVFSPKA
jgi:drug/metabolite transporter (DMT)-like permease